MTEAQYLPFVRCIARMVHFRAQAADFDDLVGAGCVALVLALRRWDPAGGASQMTFAAYAVKGAMIDHLRQLDPLGRRCREQVNGGMRPNVQIVDECAAAAVPARNPDLDRQIWARELLRHTQIPRDRRVIVQTYWGDRELLEIGQVLGGVTGPAITHRKTRALAQMRAAAA
jgi:RNA polymerase sigma factor (sigma-70 family)